MSHQKSIPTNSLHLIQFFHSAFSRTLKVMNEYRSHIIRLMFLTFVMLLSYFSDCHIIPRPTYLTVSPRSETEIMVTWKDNASNETGFQIERKIASGSFQPLNNNLPVNSRFYLDNSLTANTSCSYRVRTKEGDRVSQWSNDATTTTDSINSIVRHSNGLEVDSKGGGANGWSYFNILGYDQLYDGHLQLWIVGDSKVYDGDDDDFTSDTAIKPYSSSSGGTTIEHSAAASGSNNPVVIRLKEEEKDEDLEIHQFTYQEQNKNWIVIKWIVCNFSEESKNVKLSLFLDGDAGGELSVNDTGDFISDAKSKLVYLQSGSTTKCIGMALISNLSYYENYQINSFDDSRTPDNSGGGENARLELFKGNVNYVGKKCNVATDLNMTLVCNLGSIQRNGNFQVLYVIAAGNDLADLKFSINDAINFAQSISLFI